MNRATSKLFDVRDDGTQIPVLATLLSLVPGFDADARILARAGYTGNSDDQLYLTKLATDETRRESFEWCNGRTLRVAHDHILANWYELQSGQVIDVQFVLGETEKPKEPGS